MIYQAQKTNELNEPNESTTDAREQYLYQYLYRDGTPSDMTYHILPINDLKEHEENTTCHCYPVVTFENGDMIVSHNSFDGREASEQSYYEANSTNVPIFDDKANLA